MVTTAGLAWQRASNERYKALYQAEAAKRAEDALVKSEKHLRQEGDCTPALSAGRTVPFCPRNMDHVFG